MTRKDCMEIVLRQIRDQLLHPKQQPNLCAEIDSILGDGAEHLHARYRKAIERLESAQKSA